MAQVIERSLLTPNIRGSNPVVGTICMYRVEKTKNNEKETVFGPI